MITLASRVYGLLLPVVLIAFLALYVMAIRSGVEPETALLQAGAAGALLAVLGRAAMAVISVPPNRSDDTSSGLAGTTAQPTTTIDQARSSPAAGGQASEQQQQAVSG